MTNKEPHRNPIQIRRFLDGAPLAKAKGDIPAPAADFEWRHYNLSDPKALSKLTADKSLPELARIALTGRESRPRVEVIGDDLVAIIRGVNFNPESDQDDMVSLRIFARTDLIITAQYRDLKTTQEFAQRADSGYGEKSSAELLAKLVAVMFEKIEDTVMQFSDEVDQLEELSDDAITATARDNISEMRRKVVGFRRHLLPQREAASRLRNAGLPWLSEKHGNLHAENYERIMRNLDELDEIRDKLTIVKEEVQSVLSERLNRNTYVLSVVAAIFLPLGFLTGLMGINIGGMPGVDSDAAFWLFCALLSVIVILQIIIMRKLRWF